LAIVITLVTLQYTAQT